MAVSDGKRSVSARRTLLGKAASQTREKRPMLDLDSIESLRSSLQGHKKGQGSKQRPNENHFINLVETTVEHLKGSINGAGYEAVRNILSTIRRQYDEVHHEADLKEAKLMELRKDLRLIEAESTLTEEVFRGHTRETALKRISEVRGELLAASEKQKVYQHLVERVHRELRITQQKVGILQMHLDRKTREVYKKQEYSRRVYEDKLATIRNLEDTENALLAENDACTSALQDLEKVLRRRFDEVTGRKEFERWRNDTALDAATEAFEATAGRYRKIYAIEKLTGNCLQKLTFEQAEQSQATEDGFQKIREVTGLTDVMDIVHKFLNRETEHEQLRTSVREAESKLVSLREAEITRPGEDVSMTLSSRPESRSLGSEIIEFEQILEEANRNHTELRSRLKNGTLLMEKVVSWAERIAKALSVYDLQTVRSQEELPRFFSSLASTVEELLLSGHAEMPDARIWKLTSDAAEWELSQQNDLLANRDFFRLNCRVASSSEQKGFDEMRRIKGVTLGDDDRLDLEFAAERDRMKQEVIHKGPLKKNRTPDKRQVRRNQH